MIALRTRDTADHLLRRHRPGIPLLTFIVMVLLFAASTLPLPAAAYERPAVGARVDVPPDGSEIEYPLVCGPVCKFSVTSLSADGRFAVFHTGGTNLVPGDTNETADVFVRTLASGKIERVSVASDGSQAVGARPDAPDSGIGTSIVDALSIDGSLSANGRYVSFTSGAVNLVPGDTNGMADVFLHDRKKGTTQIVSVSSGGERGNLGSGSSQISGNGRFVTFTSGSDLTPEETCVVPGVVCASQFVYRRDLKRGTTELVSVTTSGQKAQGATSSISHDGRYIVFNSSSTELTGEPEPDQERDVYIRDMREGKTTRVSTPPDEPPMYSPLDGLGSWVSNDSPAISADGRYVAFQSHAMNLVPNDGNGTGGTLPRELDAFVRDMQTGRIERVSVTSAGEEVGRDLNEGPFSTSGQVPAISPDGRFVVFTSSVSEMGIAGAFVHDRLTGATTRIPDGQVPGCEGGSPTNRPGIARRGQAVAVLAGSCGPSHHGIVIDRGADVGVGGFGGSPSPQPPDENDEGICIEGTCIPPQGFVSFLGDSGQATGALGTDIIETRIAYRPNLGDLYVALELDHMPPSPKLAALTAGVVYGMSFTLDAKAYEIRATSIGLGPHGETTAAFGLFSCSKDQRFCSKVSDLHGGYGTTGMRVVFSLPLEEIGLEEGGTLNDVIAYSGLGSYMTGASKILDRLKLNYN